MGYSASAKWEAIDAPGSTQLRIGLWNGATVTLISPTDGAAFAIVSEGDRAYELDQMTHAQFQAWLQRAQGRR